MTLDAIKARLHEYIEHADPKKTHALFTLLEGEMPVHTQDVDVNVLDMLDERWDAYMAGKTAPRSLEEMMESLKAHRRKDDL